MAPNRERSWVGQSALVCLSRMTAADSQCDTSAQPTGASGAVRVAWLTDIHLNFVDASRVESFLNEVRSLAADAVLITGDIAEARDVVQYLEHIDEALQTPIYFVLGNHDFYFGSIAQVRSDVAELCARRPRLHYLTTGGAVQLAPGVGLAGDDGWADARTGDYLRSLVMMNDYKLIEELAGVSKMNRWGLLQALGDAAAVHVRKVLPAALEGNTEAILATHVPPLREACWHQGQISNDEWAPHFVCMAVGEAILDVMRVHREKRLTVLCGHTHGDGESHPLPNVQILTGGADYGRPEVKRVFEFR